MNEDRVQNATDLFGARRIILAPKSRTTERGELLKYFSLKTGKDIGRIAYLLTRVPTADLYYMQKRCDTYDGPWTKCFYGMLKAPKEGSLPV